MTSPGKLNFLARFFPVALLSACFAYFVIFTGYLPLYQEQTQLFLFDWNYFSGFLSKPGGLMEYSGAFLTQFCLIPVSGAFIYTLLDFIGYALTRYIFKKYNITGILWSFVPVLIIVILQTDYLFNPGYITGILLILTFFSVYLTLTNNSVRLTFGLTGWVFLYIVAGGLSLLATALCIIHELLYSKNRCRVVVTMAYALEALLLPFIASGTIYYINTGEVWFDPFFFSLRKITKYSLLLFVVYYPLLLSAGNILPDFIKKLLFQPEWNIKAILSGIIIISAMAGAISKFAYNPRLNTFFEIDNCVQKARWNKVLELSSQAGGANRFNLYYTNLALYKSGHLGDRMFCYNQIGIPGLYLDREGDEISLFLGSELAYHLGNINEAFRWAFDSMVSNGKPSPRLLKQLILTSLVNGDPEVAIKYLDIMDKSLFYRNWARHYKSCISHPDLLPEDSEIIAKRHLLLHTDFVSDPNDSEMSLEKLLEDHPDNKMAFEYYMASLLLDKNLESFADNISRIKAFGFREMPLHYEEALLMYMAHIRKNVLPEGFGIRKTTVQHFQEWVKASSTYNGRPEDAASFFYRSYGNTYWFYFHFINTSTSPHEAKHQFN
jgi:hypothetical protein